MQFQGHSFHKINIFLGLPRPYLCRYTFTGTTQQQLEALVIKAFIFNFYF